ncbi:MAG: hypothetical protein KDD04_04875, partial [Sinomicrobium sp.]|nr:hypothetical protein [Sinomicrobium sp.]
ALASRTPSGRVGMYVKYENPEREEVTLGWGNTSKDNLDFSKLAKDRYTINIKVEGGDIGETFEGEVTYQTSDMNESEYPELSAGHAYMVHSVDFEEEELNVINPHDTSVLEFIPANLLEKYNFKVRIGTISDQD